MPRYFFNIMDSHPDTDGSDFPDLDAAKGAAIRLCGELIQEIDGNFWAAPVWRLEVTNSDQRALFTLTFSAEEHQSPS